MQMLVVLLSVVFLLSGCILKADPGTPDDGPGDEIEEGYSLGEELFNVGLWGNVAEEVNFQGERAVKLYRSMADATFGHRVYTLPEAPVDLSDYDGFTIRYYLKNTLTGSQLLIVKTEDKGAFDITLNETEGEHTVDVYFADLNKRGNSEQDTLNLSVVKTIEVMGIVKSKGDPDWEMYIFEIKFFKR